MSDGKRSTSVDEALHPDLFGVSATETGAGLTALVPGEPAPPRSRVGMVLGFLGLLAAAVAVAVSFLGYPTVLKVVRQSALRVSGHTAPAQILAVRPTDGQLQGERVVELRVLVMPPDGPAYPATVTQPFSKLVEGRLHPGMGASVKVDPDDPESVVVMATGATLAPVPPGPPTPRPSVRKVSPGGSASDSASGARLEDAEWAQQAWVRELFSEQLFEAAGKRGRDLARQRTARIDATAGGPSTSQPVGPSCVLAAECCSIVSGQGARALCQNIALGRIPAPVCDTALSAYQEAARALGRDCPQ